MLEYRDSEDIIAEIILGDSVSSTVLLLEGDHEASILGGVLMDGFTTIICGGKENVIKTVTAVTSQFQCDIFALTDRDFSDETEIDDQIADRVVLTDNYDLTADIVYGVPGIIERTIQSHSYFAAEVLKKERAETLDSVVIDYASRISGAHRGAIVCGCPARLSQYKYSEILNPQFSTPSADNVIDGMAFHREMPELPDLKRREIRRYIENDSGERKVCGGHLIAAVINQLILIARGQQLSTRTIEMVFRAHATPEVLAEVNCLIRLNNLAYSRVGLNFFNFL